MLDLMQNRSNRYQYYGKLPAWVCPECSSTYLAKVGLEGGGGRLHISLSLYKLGGGAHTNHWWPCSIAKYGPALIPWLVWVFCRITAELLFNLYLWSQSFMFSVKLKVKLFTVLRFTHQIRIHNFVNLTRKHCQVVAKQPNSGFLGGVACERHVHCSCWK